MEGITLDYMNEIWQELGPSSALLGITLNPAGYAHLLGALLAKEDCPSELWARKNDDFFEWQTPFGNITVTREDAP